MPNKIEINRVVWRQSKWVLGKDKKIIQEMMSLPIDGRCVNSLRWISDFVESVRGSACAIDHPQTKESCEYMGADHDSSDNREVLRRLHVSE